MVEYILEKRAPKFRDWCPRRRRNYLVLNDDGSEVYPIDVLLGSQIEWDPHRSVGDFASTVILKRRWQRNGFADAGDRHPCAFDIASQL
ncbi:hypothetical protein Busp01_48240 [Trinickia caryophylli]|nr:hypothetical protein Busp01_48240 [Trinickia caryophylli]